MTEEGSILVTGFLGAGKSRVCAGLRACGIAAIEADGLTTGAAEVARHALRGVVAVADGANLERQIADPVIAPLVRAQLAGADLVAVSRTDAVGDGPMDLARGLTDAPVVAAPFGQIDAASLPRQQAGSIASMDLREGWVTWSYRGGATLSVAHAEALLEERPNGVYRIAGVVRTGTGGLEVEVIGRARQTTPAAAPEETVLRALGPSGVFRQAAMDALFSEKVADSMTASGLYSYR